MIVKTLTFDKESLANLERAAKQRGLTLSQYLRLVGHELGFKPKAGSE